MPDDLALALELAELADGITMDRFRAGDLRVETKADLTPVTEADHAVEEAVRARLADARPGDAVLGEEFGERGAARDGRRWIVDPIDGTMSYMRREPTWATLIALQVEGEAEVAVVSAPAGSRRWWAARGRGAFARGERIRVSEVGELSAAQLCWGGLAEWEEVGRVDVFRELERRCGHVRELSDAWQYMMVAEGAAELAIDPVVSLWDLAAVQLIVEEAGGRFTDFAGARRADGGDGLATNGLLHDAALAIVGR